jgi:hypothetical protein
MAPWPERSPEIAALLNPAFCGVLLFSSVEAHVGQSQRGMPFESAFLILPLVLHGPTRAIFPKGVGSPFQSWVSGNPRLRIGLAERVRAAERVTREALMFLGQRECVAFDGGTLRVGRVRPRMASQKIVKSQDVRTAVLAAAMLGRLLAGAGTSTTVYTSLGISP